jgi:hypothetical protein
MSCDAKFPAELSINCIFTLIAELRNGVTPATIKRALWTGGCLMEKLSPPSLSTIFPEDDVSISSFSGLELDALVDQLEAAASSLSVAEVGILSTPESGTQGWEVLIPIMLEIIKLIIANRQKKPAPVPAPTPAPTPAPVKSIPSSGSGVVKAPKTS